MVLLPLLAPSAPPPPQGLFNGKDGKTKITNGRFEAFMIGSGTDWKSTAGLCLALYDSSGKLVYTSSAKGATCTSFDDVAGAATELLPGAKFSVTTTP
jgi:hypothetical protein